MTKDVPDRFDWLVNYFSIAWLVKSKDFALKATGFTDVTSPDGFIRQTLAKYNLSRNLIEIPNPENHVHIVRNMIYSNHVLFKDWIGVNPPA